MNDSIEIHGRVGNYLYDGNVISFQLGEGVSLFSPLAEGTGISELTPAQQLLTQKQHLWLGVNGYQLLMRGAGDTLVDEVTREIKENRLLPRLYSKQIKMLYGHGPIPYVLTMTDGKLRREFRQVPEVQAWLDNWADFGIPSAEEFCKTCIKNYYYFGDFFVKWRFSRGKRIGMGMPVAALEALDNRYCRLATRRQDVASEVVPYSDLTHVAYGRWMQGTGYRIYPRLRMADIDSYQFAAISHHRERSVDEYYGVNETHQGARPYIQGSNQTAHYINSFLRNSLAAKIHIIVPNAWLESKRSQLQKLCDENKRRQARQQELITYNGMELGTDYRESLVVEYLRAELRKVADYLTGADNQGKAYSSISFMDGQGHEQQWRFESVDMKYKEYIDALIQYDKRTEEALLSSVGLDASISAVSKDGLISKSGSDAYYNYLIYIMQLTPEDEVCAEPLNQALRICFPKLYAEGLRIGFYREVPQRQEDTPPVDRLNKQQS